MTNSRDVDVTASSSYRPGGFEMQRTWAPDLVIDIRTAQTLIETQFPETAPIAIEPLDHGWDNSVFRVNGRFVFRFPRREIAATLIETELRCLPLLAPLLPVPIPFPRFAGGPSDAYRWPFAGYDYIPGELAAGRTPDIAWRRNLAVALAHVLKALHQIEVDARLLEAVPPDRLERLNSAKRRTITETRLDFLVASGVVDNPRPIVELLDRAPAVLPAAPCVVAHGDLHAGQLLVTASGCVAGLLDWGDVHLGSPAVDLAAIHQLLPLSLHDAFLDVYGQVDAVTRQAARSRAAWHAVALGASAIDANNRPLAAEAKLALSFLSEQMTGDY